MPSLLDLKKARAQALSTNQLTSGQSFLLYGPSGSGKTTLASTIAKLPGIRSIYWFDLENGSEVLFHQPFTDEELSKVTLFKIKDSKLKPLACETLLNLTNSSTPQRICFEHGKINCKVCPPASTMLLDLNFLGPSDAIVIDSGTQLASSFLSLATLNLPPEAKLERDHYGAQGRWLDTVLSGLQALSSTNVIFITHEYILEEVSLLGKKTESYIPQVGTRNFSETVAKYFSHVVRCSVKQGKMHTTSLPLKETGVRASSRSGVDSSLTYPPSLLPFFDLKAPPSPKLTK
jgi:hypothetical protein